MFFSLISLTVKMQFLLIILAVLVACLFLLPKSSNTPKPQPPGPPPVKKARDPVDCEKIPRGAPYSGPEDYCQSDTTGWCYSIGGGVDNPQGWFAITSLAGGCDTKPLCQDLGKVCGLSNIESLR